MARNIKLKYRKSVLGILWTALGPAATAVVYFTVFKFVMRVQIPHYLVVVVAGTLMWSFYSNAILNGLESIVGNHTLLSKVPMPLNVFPLSEAVTLFINLLVAIPIIFAVMAATEATFTWSLVWLPVLLSLFFIQAYSIGVLCAIGFIFLRDLRHIFIIIFQVLFYLNPIVYTLDMIPEGFRWIPNLVPSAFLFEALQDVLAFSRPPNIERLGIGVGWTFFFLLVSSLVFFRLRKKLTEII